MKKMLATGLLAICAIALTQQDALAWTNTRFSMGFNFEHQGGGNSILWGVWKSGQPGAPDFQPYCQKAPVYYAEAATYQIPYQVPYQTPVAPYYPPAQAPYNPTYPMPYNPTNVRPTAPTGQPYQQATFLRPLPYSGR